MLEAVLSLALILFLMASVATFYDTAIRARETGSKMAFEAIQARAMLEKIADEIRHAYNFIPGDGKGFEGTEESITIVRSRLPEHYAFDEYQPNDTLPPGQMDIMRVSYHLYRDEENRLDDNGEPICYGVWRTEQKTFDPNPSITVATDQEGAEGEEAPEMMELPKAEGELYAPEIKYLRFRYFDGLKWKDTWNVKPQADEAAAAGEGESGLVSGIADDGGPVLPQAVEITIGRIPEPEQDESMKQLEKADEEQKKIHHADRFALVVYLPQSDQSLMSSRRKGAASDTDNEVSGDWAGGGESGMGGGGGF